MRRWLFSTMLMGITLPVGTMGDGFFSLVSGCILILRGKDTAMLFISEV
ncbi:MAG: hypothetical protein GY732_01230 [Gammaproteobacteria bacterium]|nr:hypothetical protein [Gammaproteobacteria bacterium]